jgi:hypothetical protein
MWFMSQNTSKCLMFLNEKEIPTQIKTKHTFIFYLFDLALCVLAAKKYGQKPNENSQYK